MSESLSPPAAPFAAVDPGLQDWLRLAWRQRWLIGGSTLLVGVLALVFTSLQRPSYATTAKVWVQTEQQGAPTFLSGIAAYRESPMPDPVNRKMETEMALMVTRAGAREVIQALGIRPEQLAQPPIDQLQSRLHALWPFKAKEKVDPGEGLEDLFLKSVTVTPMRSGLADTTSNVLEVRFECADKALAPRALEALLQHYLRAGTQQNRELGLASAHVIQEKMDQAGQEVASIEDRMLKVAMRSGGRDAVLPGTPRSTPLPGGGDLRLDLGAELNGPAQSQALAQLKAQTQDLQAQLEAARALYTEDHETVRGLRQRLADAEARLRGDVAATARADAEMNRLERARVVAQERFVELRRRLDQIDLYLQVTPGESSSRSIVDAPVEPRLPERTKRSMILGMGLAGGLLLGLLLAGLRELLDHRLHSPAEARRLLGLRALGSLPVLPRGAKERLDGQL